MTLLSPLWLILLAPLAIALLIWRPPTLMLLILRACTFMLILLALAGLSLRLPSRLGTVVIVADRSYSMPASSRALQKEAIQLIHSKMSMEDQLAVVAFGQQAVIEHPPSNKPLSEFEYQVGGNASNLGEAIELALSLIPSGSPGRILVLSDGKYTGRDPQLQISKALARNVAIDYRHIDRPAASDLAIARIDAPSSVSLGESYLMTAWVFAPTTQEVTFELKRGEEVISKGTRSLNSGMNRFAFRDRADQLGNQTYLLKVIPTGSADQDPVIENNLARFIVGVSGPRPLLHVAESKNSGLARLLRQGKLALHMARPEEVKWTLDELSRYSAVVLENVSADKIGNVGMETIASWVRETGAGLMMTGGKSSYGPGGYYKSPLEPILPVSMELRNEHRKLALAIMVALDRSGSMAAPVAGGKVKMDLANIGTAQVLEMLGPQDEFGCIAVDTAVHVVVPFGPIDTKNKASHRGKILGIRSQGGGIYVYEALSACAELLLKAKSGTKHIILFSDAQDSEMPGAYQQLLEKCSQAGITVSVIGLGKETDKDGELLKDIAKRGNGRIFFSDNPEELPRLFAQDTFVVARNTFIEAEKGKVIGIRHMPGLASVIDQTLPSPPQLGIGGYNLCYLRPGATLGTVTLDEYKAPTLATWRAGAGRVVCYTGEADGNYAGNMPNYAQVGEYYTSLARWAAGAANPLPTSMLLTQEIRDGVNIIQLHLDPERERELFATLPKVTTLKSQPGQAPRVEQSLLRWTGADTLALEVPVESGESTLCTVEVPGYDRVALPPVCVPYSPEFKPMQSDRGLITLERLGRATGGQERLDLPGIWKDLPRQERFIPMARWLLLAALILLLLEVLERRTGLLSSWSSRKLERSAEPENARSIAWKTKAMLPKVEPQGNSSTIEVTRIGQTSPAKPAETAASLPEDGSDLMEALRKARQRSRGRRD